ncbi:MAG: lytic murein transglycosylase [Candidatus Parcubacteria bacterium]|nr:lytic murein transglycosylase [Candidatus Parcubacteria bacterium]
MKDLFFKITVLSVLGILSVFGLKTFSGTAESAEDLAVICLPEEIEQTCQNITPTECRVILEKCGNYYIAESARIENDLTKTSAEKATLQNKVNSLNSKIKNLSYQINQSNLVIKDLGFQIEDTKGSIDKTNIKVDDSKQKLAGILRTIYEEDQRSTAEVFLAEGISDFFDNLVSLEALNEKNKELLDQIKSLKIYLEDQKVSLDEEKGDLEKVVSLQALAKQESESAKKEQENLLTVTKGKESEYQKLLLATKKRAQEINSRLFELIGVPAAPTFGEAYQIAKFVSGQTGVRPALLLAVLYQESSIGKNVGQCYLKDITNGRGVRVNGTPISNVMKPSRDVQPFLQITEALGRDPLNTPVSCPIPSVGGYGGAMGPAQFIPSTWANPQYNYGQKVAELTGKPADPWNINDAFLAAGLYLAKAGATKQTYDYEWCSALTYFAGSCSSINQIRYEFYGDNVMYWAAKFDQDIKDLDSGLK